MEHQENSDNSESVQTHVAEGKTGWDYLWDFCLWATLVFLVLMLLAILTMTAFASFAISYPIESRIFHINDLRETRWNYVYSSHDPSTASPVIYQGIIRHGTPKIPKSLFFGMCLAFSSFLLVLGFLKSFTLLGFLRKSLLKFLLQEPVESIDYWAREENAALGRKIDRLSSNVLLCFISFYLQ